MTLSVLQGLLKMKLLPRLRYILEVVRPSPRVVQDILEILTRIARHSSSSATQVATITAVSSDRIAEINPDNFHIFIYITWISVTYSLYFSSV